MPDFLFSKTHHHLHFPFSFHERKFEISEHAALYLTNTVRALAISLVGIFLPIYIFNISGDYLFFHTNPTINGISWVISYFLIRSVVVWLAILLFGNLIFSKFHFQLSIMFSFLFLVIEILLWQLSADNLIFILAAGFVAGFKTTFYWIPYHIFFLRKSGRKMRKFGKNTGLRFFLTRIMSAIGPALGGLIIVNFGFPVLFMTSIILLVVAALPIAVVVHEWEHQEHNMVQILKKYLLNKRYLRLTMGFVGQGIDNWIYLIFWPILLFFVLHDFEKVGFISSISFLLSSVAVLLIGKVIDKHGTKKIHGFGSLLNSLLYLPRMFFSSPTLFYSLDVTDRFLSGTYSLPIMSLSYQKANKLGGSDFILYRELCLHGGIIIALFFIMLAFQVLTLWKWVFGLAMIGSLMTYLIELDKN